MSFERNAEKAVTLRPLKNGRLLRSRGRLPFGGLRNLAQCSQYPEDRTPPKRFLATGWRQQRANMRRKPRPSVWFAVPQRADARGGVLGGRSTAAKRRFLDFFNITDPKRSNGT